MGKKSTSKHRHTAGTGFVCLALRNDIENGAFPAFLREEVAMKVRDVTQDAHIASPDEDAGILPVGDKDRLVGMISDRDIFTR
jgi:hypothetical protein